MAKHDVNPGNDRFEWIRQIIIKGENLQMTDHQCLEALLFNISENDIVELAQNIENETGGSFAGAINAGYDRLIGIQGVGNKTAFFLDFFGRAAKKYLLSSYAATKGVVLNTAEKLCEYFKTAFLGVVGEEIHAIGLNEELCVICNKKLADETPNRVPFTLRSLNEFVIKNNLTRIVNVHNHPSGIYLPSSEDIHITKIIIDFLIKIEVELIDHITVGVGGAASMRSSVYAHHLWDYN